MSFDKLPSKATLDIEAFTIHFSDEKLDFMKKLIELSPIADKTYESNLPDRSLGLSHEWFVNAVEVWKNDFDWRKHEAHMNTFNHFKATVKDEKGDLTIHFVGLFSNKPDAVPIVLLHGWPGSFIEFLPMLDLFRKQFTPNTLAHHFIVPSLPGYTFSDPPPMDTDFRIEDVARVLNSLAIGVGFGDGYVVQGGDIGSKVGRIMAAVHDECKAAHLNFMTTNDLPFVWLVNFGIILDPPTTFSDDAAPVNDLEKEGLERAKWFERIGSAYALEQATRPSTIGLVLASSPLALLAWIGEKFLDWTDEDPPLELILESVSLYWLTGCYPSSIYPYRQLFTPGSIGAHENPAWYINKPFGFSYFPKEIAPVPQRWTATTGNLVFYRQHQKGGHFAAVEQTEVLKTDLEDFVQQVWKK